MMAMRHTSRSCPPTAARVHHVLSAAPRTLPSDSDERSGWVERKLQTGDPFRLAEIVRDLAWRQRRGRASRQDVQLLQRASLELAGWLSAQKGIERATARRRIWGAVERTVSRFI